jgi:hypothetical protein
MTAPILFLFRHAVELTLKDLLSAYHDVQLSQAMESALAPFAVFSLPVVLLRSALAAAVVLKCKRSFKSGMWITAIAGGVIHSHFNLNGGTALFGSVRQLHG